MAVFVCIFVLWIFSVCVHEYAHARVALAGGDFTVEEKGYLEFNPLRYTDPFVSILMPLVILVMGGIGLPGGAVWINHSLIRSRVWDSAVSLAGPASNFALAILLGTLFRLGVLPSDPQSTLGVTMAFFVYLQVTSVILNMLPLPGLDGFGAIMPWLPLSVREAVLRLPPATFMIILLLLWQTEFFSKCVWILAAIIMAILGVDSNLAIDGYREFHFWNNGP